MPGRKHRLATIAGAVLLVSALAMPAAHAQSTDPTSATITAGLLSLSAIDVPDFTTLGVTGTDQQTTATMSDFTVADLRGGVGGGWHLTAQASQFTAGAETLPAGSLAMQAPAPVAAVGNLALPPVPEPLPVTLDVAGASTIASAAEGTLVVPSGTGEWTFTSLADNLTLDVPAEVVPGTYTSTVTVTLIAGPAV